MNHSLHLRKIQAALSVALMRGYLLDATAVALESAQAVDSQEFIVVTLKYMPMLLTDTMFSTARTIVVQGTVKVESLGLQVVCLLPNGGKASRVLALHKGRFLHRTLMDGLTTVAR